MNRTVIIVFSTLIAVTLACLWTDSNLARAVMCLGGVMLLYFTGCFGFGFNTDLKGRMMNRIEARFMTEVCDESFHENDPECEFSLNFRAPYTIESVQDELLAFFLSLGYTNKSTHFELQGNVGFLTQNKEHELCVLISPSEKASDEYQVRVGPST